MVPDLPRTWKNSDRWVNLPNGAACAAPTAGFMIKGHPASPPCGGSPFQTGRGAARERDRSMRKWEQKALLETHKGATVKLQITFSPERDYILVTTRRFGLPSHTELGETIDRFNFTLPGLLNAIRAAVEATVDVSEIHGIEHGVIEVAEITELEHDPYEPF